MYKPTRFFFGRHLPRLHDFLWLAEDGMKMQGYNGSQLWDTTFAVQAIAATGLAHEFAACLRRAGAYVDATQARPLSCNPVATALTEAHTICRSFVSVIWALLCWLKRSEW